MEAGEAGRIDGGGEACTGLRVWVSAKDQEATGASRWASEEDGSAKRKLQLDLQ